MIPQHVIVRKRNGEELPEDELRAFLQDYADGHMPEYQMAAFLMAVYFRGMSARELAVLADTMLRSGVVVDLDYLDAPRVDKHSIGGVGDKVSLILAPLVAALDVYVPMMSGRGLGHTGGTVDKLESIPGFTTALSLDRFQRQLAELKCALIAPTSDIAPLDKKLYALRDVTGTVESIPLISSSIMSKKLAEGINGLVLDIKRGNGSFMPELERGLELARTMIGIGELKGCRTVALVTAMDRPLGYAVGNALETEEALLTLRGEGPEDLVHVTLALAAEMLVLAGVAQRPGAGYQLAADALADGRAAERMRRIIEAQGGNPAVLDDPAMLPQAPARVVLEAERDGYAGEMNVRAIGEAAVALGAGRVALDSEIDPAVGFHITIKPGERVLRGQPLATIFMRQQSAGEGALRALRSAMPIVDERVQPLPLVSHRVTAAGTEEIRQ
ncbi:MAG TPA: thymidine phosphorylase [Longimicrobiales bacterium]|nr:thymidine phosphorylase [Longimicrobiales bacterium]